MTDLDLNLKLKLKLAMTEAETVKDVKLDRFTIDDFIDQVRYSDDTYVRIPLLVTSEPSRIAYLLCWNRFQSSGIHDHPDGGCLVKVLKGKLHETTVDSIKLLRTGYTTYQSPGVKGRHSMRSSKYRSVSLHIYEPADYKPKFYPSFQA